MILEPQWLIRARDKIGLKEIAGPQHEAEILKLATDALVPYIHDDETAWCSTFACAMLERSGIISPRSPAARSFLHWGIDCMDLGDAQIPVGAIVVFSRPPSPIQGHVGFAVGITAEGNILTLGGNQSNSVSIAPIKGGRLIGARWPIEERADIKLLHRIPFVSSTKQLSTNEA
jgi:uncharacterized protein (TIGR02594 family)